MKKVDFNNGLVKALEGIKDTETKKKLMLEYIDFVHEKGAKKAEELATTLKRKVRYAVYTGDEKTEACICFYTAPKTDVKLRCTDIMMQSVSRAAKALFDATILKNESDPRVFKQDEDNDFFYLAALDDCVNNWNKADILVKKKLREFQQEFESSELLKRIAFLKFFFHKDMEGKSVYEIEKEWTQLTYILEKGGMNITMKRDG